MGNCWCFERRSSKIVVDWDKLKEQDDEIAKDNDMRVAPPKNTTNVKTPLLAAGDQHQSAVDQSNYTKSSNSSNPNVSGNNNNNNNNSNNNSFNESLKKQEKAILCTKYDESKLHAIAFECKQKLDIQDRKFHFQIFPKCFIAADMVTLLVNLDYADNEKDAISIGNSLHETIHVIEHVSDEKKLFKNKKDRFWHFIDKNMKIPPSSTSNPNNNSNNINNSNKNNNKNDNDNNNNNKGLTIAAAASAVSENNSQNNNNNNNNNNKEEEEYKHDRANSMDSEHSESRDSQFDPLSNPLGNGDSLKATNLPRDSDMQQSLIDSEFGDDYADELQSDISRSQSQSVSESEEFVKFRDIRDEMIKYLDLKDQKWMLKIYKECAVATDVVKVLIYKLKIAPSTDDAIKIGQKLMDYKLMVHCSHKHKVKFSNDKQLFLHFINFNTNNLEGLWMRNNFEMKKKLMPSLRVKDRTWMAKKHEKCFKGSDWVKACLQTKIALTILHAREIGTKLISLGYIEHVAKDQTRLWNHPQMWYRFT